MMCRFDLCPDATHDCGCAWIEVQCAVEDGVGGRICVRAKAKSALVS